MENWNNLGKLITLEREHAMYQKELSQEMIEACIIDDKAKVSSLLKQGITPNCYEDLLTPLIACINNDNFELANYLLNAGASISYKPNLETDNAFWHSLKNKYHDFLDMFIKRRCILSHDTETNQPPLIFATIKSDREAVEILLSHKKVKVNERDGNGNTALHYNLSKSEMTPDDHEIGRMLIAAGADTNATNLEGKRPEELILDENANATILASRLQNELPINEPQPEVNLEEDLTFDIEEPENKPSVAKTRNNKMKI